MAVCTLLSIEVRADNVTALTTMASMKTTGRGVSLSARELALDFADGCYKPEVIAHMPGVTITVVDTLSRKIQSNKAFSLLSVLKNVEEKHSPQLDISFYPILSLPKLHPASQACNVSDDNGLGAT